MGAGTRSRFQKSGNDGCGANVVRPKLETQMD